MAKKITNEDLLETINDSFTELEGKTATKENIVASEARVEGKITASEERLGQKIDKVLTAVDGIAKEHKDQRAEFASNLGAHDRFEADITEVKERVKVVEKKAGIQE